MSILEKGGLVPASKRIVFLGDSITEDGRYIAHLHYYCKKHLPNHQIEMINLGLSSETVSGLSEPDHPFPRPCILDRVDRALALSKPEWVVVGYGINDGVYYPFSEERFQHFQLGMLELLDRIKATGAKVIVMTPPPLDEASYTGKLLPEGAAKYSFSQAYAHYTDVMKIYRNWVMEDIRKIADRVVDIYNPLTNAAAAARQKDPSFSSGDGIHPSLSGHWIIARELLGELFRVYPEIEPPFLADETRSAAFGLVMQRHKLLSNAWKESVGHSNPGKAETMPLEQALAAAEKLDRQIEKAMQQEPCEDVVSDWNGYVKRDFYVNGRVGTYIEPKAPAKGKPWVWRAEFFYAFNTADVELLKRGWGLCYYRVCNLYGCPESVDLMKGFHDAVTLRFGLSKTAVLFGFSRGGLYSVNYAAAYPADIEAVYLDAPALNFRSWPGGKGFGNGAANEWKDCLEIYGLDEDSSIDFSENPLDKAELLVKADIPVLIVAGDADSSVPYIENGKIFCETMKALGGRVKTIVKPGVGHHPHSLEDPTEIVEFILQQTGR